MGTGYGLVYDEGAATQEDATNITRRRQLLEANAYHSLMVRPFHRHDSIIRLVCIAALGHHQ